MDLEKLIQPGNHITQLRLYDRVTTKEAVEIVGLLSHPHCCLEELYMNCSRDGKEEEAMALAEALWKPNKLTALSFYKCRIGDKACQALVEAFQSPYNRLEYLSVGGWGRIDPYEGYQESIDIFLNRNKENQVQRILTLQQRCWLTILAYQFDCQAVIPPITVHILNELWFKGKGVTAEWARRELPWKTPLHIPSALLIRQMGLRELYLLDIDGKKSLYRKASDAVEKANNAIPRIENIGDIAIYENLLPDIFVERVPIEKCLTYEDESGEIKIYINLVVARCFSMWESDEYLLRIYKEYGVDISWEDYIKGALLDVEGERYRCWQVEEE